MKFLHQKYPKKQLKTPSKALKHSKRLGNGTDSDVFGGGGRCPRWPPGRGSRQRPRGVGGARATVDRQTGTTHSVQAKLLFWILHYLLASTTTEFNYHIKCLKLVSSSTTVLYRSFTPQSRRSSQLRHLAKWLCIIFVHLWCLYTPHAIRNCQFRHLKRHIQLRFCII